VPGIHAQYHVEVESHIIEGSARVPNPNMEEMLVMGQQKKRKRATLTNAQFMVDIPSGVNLKNVQCHAQVESK